MALSARPFFFFKNVLTPLEELLTLSIVCSMSRKAWIFIKVPLKALVEFWFLIYQQPFPFCAKEMIGRLNLAHLSCRCQVPFADQCNFKMAQNQVTIHRKHVYLEMGASSQRKIFAKFTNKQGCKSFFSDF